MKYKNFRFLLLLLGLLLINVAQSSVPKLPYPYVSGDLDSAFPKMCDNNNASVSKYADSINYNLKMSKKAVSNVNNINTLMCLLTGKASVGKNCVSEQNLQATLNALLQVSPVVVRAGANGIITQKTLQTALMKASKLSNKMVLLLGVPYPKVGMAIINLFLSEPLIIPPGVQLSGQGKYETLLNINATESFVPIILSNFSSLGNMKIDLVKIPAGQNALLATTNTAKIVSVNKVVFINTAKIANFLLPDTNTLELYINGDDTSQAKLYVGTVDDTSTVFNSHVQACSDVTNIVSINTYAQSSKTGNKMEPCWNKTSAAWNRGRK